MEELAVIGGTFLVCLASGLVPVVNAEIYLIGVALITPPPLLPLVVLAAALGQMIAKAMMFFAGVGISKIKRERARAAIEKYRAMLEKRAKAPLVLLFLSASIGLPPLFVVAILAGTLGIRFVPFFVVGLLGRAVRFGVIVYIPEAARWLSG